MNPPNQQEPQNFFDARTIAAVILIVASFVGWQYYIKHRYPQAFQKDQAAAVGDNAPAPTSEASGAPATTSGAVAPGAVGQPAKLSVAPVDERFASYASDTMSFEVSSKGMGLRQLKLNQYKDRAGATVQMGLIAGGASPLETRLLGHDQPLDFTVEKVGDRRFVGHAKVGDIEVTKTLEVVPEKYLLRYHVGVRGRAAGFLGLTTFLAEELETEKRASGVFPQLDKQEFYVETVETHDRQAFAKDDVTKSWSKVKLASIGSQYFTQTILDHSPILPDLEAAVIHHDGVARASLQHHVLNADQDFVVEYDAYVGPKSYSLLRSIDPALASVVDFGFFNWIARHIFALLQWIQSLVGNWGIAIICLTLVVRLMVLPFNIYSYKSMRAMQAIQPRLQALRERYKDDTQAQQVETMKLMRENKVNPVGVAYPSCSRFPSSSHSIRCWGTASSCTRRRLACGSTTFR